MATGTIKAVLTKGDIADNLTTDSSVKVLSAKQGKELSDQIANLIKVKQEGITSDSNSTVDLGLSGSSYNVISCNAESTTNVVCIPYLHNGEWRARLINATTGAALSEGSRVFRTYYTDK